MKREDEFTEFKKSTAELSASMISISAILNKHKKGKLIFGLRNDGTPCSFTITDATLREVSRKIYETIKPQIIPTIHTEIVDGVEIIIVDFEGEDVPYSAEGKYYIRSADEDKEMNPSQLRRLMISREYEEHWENKSSSETIDDVDLPTVKLFYDKGIRSGRIPELEDFDVFNLLSSLGLLNGSHLTNAGRILFSRNKPLVLKMAVFATEYKETFLDIKREEGNIFQLVNLSMNYLVKNIRWESELSNDGIHRNEIPEIPVEVLREAVINGFVHAKYDIPINHEIDVFPNKVSISNPGNFASEYTPIDYANRKLESFLRNEVIAEVLFRSKEVETFGTGFRKIYSLCEQFGVAVSYENNYDSFSIEFSRNNMPKNGIINGTLNKFELQLISLLRENPSYKTAELVLKTGKSLRTVNRGITSLKGKGLLVRKGSLKTGYWEVL